MKNYLQSFLPIFKNFKATNVLNAFILAGIFQAILLSLTLVSKETLDKYSHKINAFWRYVISVFYIFFITIISYTIMYIIFAYGGGMLVTGH
jgi:hypothetical protein